MSEQSEKKSWKKFNQLRFSKKSLSKGVRKLEKGTVRHARRFVSSRLDRLASVRRAVFGWIALVVVLVGVSLFQWLSFRESYVVTAAAPGGTYSEGVVGPLETLNPIFARSSAEKSAARLLFASLYNYDETGHIKGDLAESMTISDDETEYTVKLMKNIVWSDGAPLTSADVVFTTDLLRNPETRSEISGWQSFKVQAVDARTVKFTLPTTYAPFIHALTFPILPKHTLAGVKPSELREHGFSQTPISSGPFALRILQNASSDGSKKIAHFVANPRYRHGAPKLDRFQLTVYTSREDIVNALKTNEIKSTPELVYSALPESTKSLYKSSSYTINNGVYAIFNTKSEILKSQKVRQALSISVDLNNLRKKIERSVAPLDGPILPDQVSGDLPATPGLDVAKAKELLSEDGWSVDGDVRKKDGQELTIRMVALKGAGFSQTTEELAKAWRSELNVKVDIQIVDPLDPSQIVLQTILQPRNYDVLVYELLIGGDPDVYAYWHSSRAMQGGLNFANYSNVVADDALLSGRSKRDTKYRSDRYESFTKRWLADVPAIPLYQPKIDYVQLRSAATLSDSAKLVSPEDRYSNVIYWTTVKSEVYKTP